MKLFYMLVQLVYLSLVGIPEGLRYEITKIDSAIIRPSHNRHRLPDFFCFHL